MSSLSNLALAWWVFERACMSICACYGEVGIAVIPLSYKYIYGEGTLMPWDCIALRRLLAYTRRRKTIVHFSYIQIESAQPLKNGTAFPTEINSSLPIKHKHIRSFSRQPRAQSTKFVIGQEDIQVQTSTYKHLRLLRWLKGELRLYPYQTNTNTEKAL